MVIVNPVRNSSGALNPAGIILKSNPAAEQRGIISNGVKKKFQFAVTNHHHSLHFIDSGISTRLPSSEEGRRVSQRLEWQYPDPSGHVR
jgi:hypothetical protein